MQTLDYQSPASANKPVDWAYPYGFRPALLSFMSAAWAIVIPVFCLSTMNGFAAGMSIVLSAGLTIFAWILVAIVFKRPKGFWLGILAAVFVLAPSVLLTLGIVDYFS